MPTTFPSRKKILAYIPVVLGGVFVFVALFALRLAWQALADAAWSALGLESFQRDWDNEEDAVYDNWREHYGVPSR